MPEFTDLTDVHARRVSIDALDAIRPLARRHGFKHTNADVVRFALQLAAGISRCGGEGGTVVWIPEDLEWPRPEGRSGCRGQTSSPAGVTECRVKEPWAPGFKFP